MLNEIITTGGIDYPVQNVCTGLNTISFVVQMTVDEAESAFKNVTALSVKSEDEEDEEAYGEYPNVVYASVMKDAGGKCDYNYADTYADGAADCGFAESSGCYR